MITNWITLDFSALLYSCIAFIIGYALIWIRVIWVLGSKGWLLLISWVILHFILLRFTYFWNREEDKLITALFLFSIILTLSFLLLTPQVLSTAWLKTSPILLFLLLIAYVLFVERNASLFMSYKMKTEGTFRYPPYSTFKEEINWSDFFASHHNRQWVQEALVAFFNTGEGSYNDAFRNALFKAWEQYNLQHEDKISFTENGILKYGKPGGRSLIFLCTNENFMTWWMEQATTNEEAKAMLIDFLNTVKEYLLSTKEGYEIGDDSRNELIQTLLRSRAVRTGYTTESATAIDEVIKTASPLGTH